MRRRILPILAALCGPQAAATAGTTLPLVVCDNHVPAPAVNNGRTNDPDYAIHIEHADDFSLAAASTLNGVTWHGLYEGNQAGADQFSLRIFPMDAGVPAYSPLFDIPLAGALRTDTGLSIAYRLKVYAYSAAFPDLTLGPGAYALSLFNHTADGTEWLWACRDNSTVGGSFMILGSAAAWNHYSGGPEFSFALTHVPEPCAALALAAAAPALLLRRRRPNRG